MLWKIDSWKKAPENLHLPLQTKPLRENHHRPQQVKKIHHAKENSISTYFRFL
jgi:hypothetical protein